MPNFTILNPFSVTPSARGSSGVLGWYSTPAGGNTDAHLIAAVTSGSGKNLQFSSTGGDSSVAGDISYANWMGAKTIQLFDDDFSLVNFFSLPPGFKLLTARLTFPDVRVQFNSGLGPTVVVSYDLDFDFGPDSNVHLQNTFGPGGIGDNTKLLGEIIVDLNMVTLPIPTMLALMTLDYAWSVNVAMTCTEPLGLNPMRFFFSGNQPTLTGTYEIESFSWTIEAEEPVNVGDEITITGDDPFNEVLVQYFDEFGDLQETVIPASVNEPFILDFAGEPPVIIISIFSGSVVLGSLLTIHALASGIYTLVPNKTSDTLQVEDVGPVETKIPNPFIKTGFIGG